MNLFVQTTVVSFDMKICFCCGQIMKIMHIIIKMSSGFIDVVLGKTRLKN